MTDSERIDKLGGPARVAELLRFDKKNGTQRVHNWKARGVPARIKLERPDLFGSGAVIPETQAHAASAA